MDNINQIYLQTLNAQQNPLDALKLNFLNRENISQNDINELLNIAIMDEQLAEFNYLISYSNSKTVGKADYDPLFLQHEKDECEHKHQLIERLRTLDADRLYTALETYPQLNSCGAKWKQESSVNSVEILKNRYEEELCAIAFYDLVIQVINKVKKVTGKDDTTTRELIKKIKADEEEHARDLKELIDQI